MDDTKIVVLEFFGYSSGTEHITDYLVLDYMLKVKRMAESVPKPRRTRGTVAYNARRYFGWGVLIVGAACGLIFQYENFYTYD
jgi:hypothetical protein